MLAFRHDNQEYDLRPLYDREAGQLLDVVESDREHLRQWMDWVDQFRELEDARRFIRQADADMEAEKRLLLAVCSEGKVLGILEMHHWDKNLKMAEIGYWIVKMAQGKGIMRAALQVFVDYLFEHLLLNRVVILHAAGNIRSAALAARLQFKTEGLLREAMRVHGQLQDKVIQALLRKEWAAICSGA